ncbi:NAD(P)H-hydrate dehydratase [Candidatus Woesebacteria bacterium RIFCSPHIGHO2_01_FULL_39_32]|uniref:ADP-dependent (S)-NAD(P)H-hydrate dehydratase n=2 Tax=Candidatus Woeseibacteriota TaxID=1752722 RepID=A0A0G0PXE5_9BACT|nr:MAG: Carbohydrate kinase, YjeF related protein [Candidatus Woesebacteria bacterium GW2011_GWA1_39_8]OGM05014.1 MAG: NAD(P)H-hydrate dehydratase [Candidatus Woesebacteria bacterium GWB1_37_5]OGM24465.1 MAG: NAD(P)H-hydrate dehydratase [Candidatus Woesebacteria bacterium RIFCSPHIGHO2_01_FULL_39_32]OGM37001.1 MAG: NAD(P)H-hydrate dehydratase [Candidatus Woesebacteria bacterium RIFCSPHIGHO2_12_FULL_38_11]OGM63771.1 MAG: NAD(P)H-hydrate dehydratase [Candidatus Woesebacteria bacterium RIFCSPLOWO2_
MKVFNPAELKKLYKPHLDSSGEDNGQITIIGGSKLFHGAPLLSLKVASRIVDMVFFSSTEPSVGDLANRIKENLMSFIWVPWEDLESYIKKSDAVLIGPGFMRFGSEKTPEGERGHENHIEGKVTREITESLLDKFPDKKWVIDAGSLQTMDAEWIPEKAVLTPNRKEFELLFGKELELKVQSLDFKNEKLTSNLQYLTSKYKCTIVLKGPETIVCSPEECVLVKGGNPGMTKGGTGDTLAGLTVALLAKNDPFLAAVSASYLVKKAADELYERVGTNYNADDLADKIPETLHKLLK